MGDVNRSWRSIVRVIPEVKWFGWLSRVRRGCPQVWVCASPYLISARPAKLSALIAIPIARPATASGWITEHHEAPHIVHYHCIIEVAGHSIIVDHACPGARPNSRELVAIYVPDKSIVVTIATST